MTTDTELNRFVHEVKGEIKGIKHFYWYVLEDRDDTSSLFDTQDLAKAAAEEFALKHEFDISWTEG